MTVTGSHALKQGTRRLDLREEREIVGLAQPAWKKQAKHYLSICPRYTRSEKE